MARKRRVQYPGTAYQVTNRGDRREDILHSDQTRRLFLETLGQPCERTGWQEHKAVACEKSTFFPMSLNWIAQRLQTGSWTYVSNLLKEQSQTHPQAQEVLPLCQ
jgi:hypothetical protein